MSILHQNAASVGRRRSQLYAAATDEALPTGEQLLRDLMDGLNPSIFVGLLTPDGTVLEANRAGLIATGLKPDDMLGRRMDEIAPWNYSLKTQQQVREAIDRAARGEASRYDVQIRGAEGRFIDIDFSLQPIRGEAGAVTFLVASAIVITERKQAEEASAAQQKMLDGLIAAVPDLVYFKDRDSRLIRINEAYAKRAGLADVRAAVGKTDFDIFGEHARQAFEDEQRIVATGKPMINQEEREDWQDGRVTWATSTKLPLFDSSGKIIGIMGISRDITERKEAEEALARERNLLRTILDILPDYVYLKDEQSRFILCNHWHGGGGVVPVKTRDVIGKTDADFFPPEQAAQFRADELAVLNGTPLINKEETFTRPDGSQKVILTTKLPFRDGSGKIVGLVGYARDITEQRRLEEQFRQSQKMEAIGQLAGGVAHDFNNILAAMMMQTGLVGNTGNLPEEVKAGLHEIRGFAERAANLTRQLLLFSRKQVMQPRDLDLNEVVTNVAKLFQRIIGEDVRLQLHLHSTPLMIHADMGMLDQVLMNLAVNARDAMPKGGRLLIETSEKVMAENVARLNPDALPGRYACLSVSDTGCGIPPEALSRIFEPFYTTKGPGKGTGLGLATVFGIVKQHQGWIKVDSKPDQGSNFQIFLPASKIKPDASAHAAAQPKPRGGTETILLVEDELAVRTLTRAILERHGYKVLEATNGVEALCLWREHHGTVALLLTDLVMPAGMSGQQLARQVQSEKPALKVVFISGYSADLAGHELQLRNGENFLQKPFTPDQILRTIRQSLDD